MALATKCPHCNTTFRVAHDQLKLRGGIVRCGACNEVFDGNAALVDPAPRQPVIIDLPAPANDGVIAELYPAVQPEMDAGLTEPSAALPEEREHRHDSAGTSASGQAAPAASPSDITDVAPDTAAPAWTVPPQAPGQTAPAMWRFGAAAQHPDTAADHAQPADPAPAPAADTPPPDTASGLVTDALPADAAGSLTSDAAPDTASSRAAEALPQDTASAPMADAPPPDTTSLLAADTAPAPGTAGILAAEPEGLAPLPEPEPDFDLDLNGDEAPTAPPAEPPAATLDTPVLAAAEPDDAFDLDFDIDTPAHVNPALAADTPALRDDYASAALTVPASETLPGETLESEPAAEAVPFHDGRQEPTLDIPDEHLHAVALHDSFELDSYPHGHDDGLHSIDERGHSLDDAAWKEHGERGERHHFGDSAAAGDLHSLAPDVPAAPEQPAPVPTAAPAALHADDDDDDDIVTLSSAASSLAPEPTAPATPLSAREPEEPGFVKRSRRQERWGKTSRIAMACALPLLLGGLAYQAVATFRNPLAAAMPSLKPALVSACALAGCKVELPSQLDALAIEQGELQTMADNIFSFSTSLRNQSPTAQSWPYIELILNDSADKPVLRRVFAPREYLPPNTDLASGFLPRSEQPVKLYFELSRVKASGYHIAVFYP